MSARHDSCPYGGATSGSDGWIVVQAKRHKERAVQANLAREGIPAYLPLLRQWPRPAVGGDVGPMFPGYVFCQPAAAQLERGLQLLRRRPPGELRRRPGPRRLRGRRVPALPRRGRRRHRDRPVARRAGGDHHRRAPARPGGRRRAAPHAPASGCWSCSTSCSARPGWNCPSAGSGWPDAPHPSFASSIHTQRQESHEQSLPLRAPHRPQARRPGGRRLRLCLGGGDRDAPAAVARRCSRCASRSRTSSSWWPSSATATWRCGPSGSTARTASPRCRANGATWARVVIAATIPLLRGRRAHGLRLRHAVVRRARSSASRSSAWCSSAAPSACSRGPCAATATTSATW